MNYQPYGHPYSQNPYADHGYPYPPPPRSSSGGWSVVLIVGGVLGGLGLLVFLMCAGLVFFASVRQAEHRKASAERARRNVDTIGSTIEDQTRAINEQHERMQKDMEEVQRRHQEMRDQQMRRMTERNSGGTGPGNDSFGIPDTNFNNDHGVYRPPMGDPAADIREQMEKHQRESERRREDSRRRIEEMMQQSRQRSRDHLKENRERMDRIRGQFP